jgi:hypothetical protein
VSETKTGHLDDVFDGEEREFLYDGAEAQLEQERRTLSDHLGDKLNGEEQVDDEVVQQQERRVRFWDQLSQNLEGEVNK